MELFSHQTRLFVFPFIIINSISYRCPKFSFVTLKISRTKRKKVSERMKSQEKPEIQKEQVKNMRSGKFSIFLTLHFSLLTPRLNHRYKTYSKRHISGSEKTHNIYFWKYRGAFLYRLFT